MRKLLNFLEALDRRGVWYRLEHIREDTILVMVTVPGQRWEVEFFADDTVEVEVFRSAGGVLGGAEAEVAIDRLLRGEDESEDRGHVP